MNRGPWLACSQPAFRPAGRALHHGAWLSPGLPHRIASIRPAVASPTPKRQRCLPLTCHRELHGLAVACSRQPSGILQDCSRICRFSRAAACATTPGPNPPAASLRNRFRSEPPSSRRTLLVFSATTAPNPLRSSLRKLLSAWLRVSCAAALSRSKLRLYNNCASPGCLRRKRSHPVAVAGRLPSEIAFGGRLLRLTRTEARAGRRALLVRFRGPDEHCCSPLPHGSAKLPENCFPCRFASSHRQPKPA